MELRTYVRACRRRWLWLAVPVLLAAGIAAALTLSAAPGHRSTMIVFVTGGNGDPDADARRLNSYIALLTGPRVAQGVVDRIGPEITADEVQRSLSAQVQEGTDLLAITATDADAERSRQVVTTAASVLVGLARQIGTGTEDGPAPAVSIVQDAVTVQEPGNLARNTGFAAVLGLLIGAIAVAVREATARTVADEDDLRRLGIATVGTISIGGRSAGHADQALAEAFRRLRSLLPALASPHPISGRGTSLLLTGSSRKEGTTAVTCGLAIAMAETGARVALVDANLRTPGVSRYLALRTGPGLAEVLTGAARVPDVLQSSLGGRVTVLPAGENAPDPGEILASPRLGATLRTLTERFDIVLVDAPALHGVADAAVLGKVADSALLVVRANRTRTADVERSMDLLERVGARLTGAVLNALPRKLPTGKDWPEVVGGGQAAGLDSLGLGAEVRTGPPGSRLDDTFVSLPTVGPARGRARVAKPETRVVEPESSVVDPESRVVETEISKPATDSEVARGWARVFTAPVPETPEPDEDPAAEDLAGEDPPHLPAQRDAGDSESAVRAEPAADGKRPPGE